MEYNLSYSSSNACSLATATDLFASLLASLYSRWYCSAFVCWYILKAVFLFFTVRCTSSFHHQDSFSLYAPFPDVSPKTYFAVDKSIVSMSFQSSCTSLLSSFSNRAAVYASLPSLFLIFHHQICLSRVCGFLLFFCLILYSITRILCCAAILSPGFILQSFTDFRFGLLVSM